MRTRDRVTNAASGAVYREVEINSSTKTTIFPADPNRLLFLVSNESGIDVHICLQPASDVETNRSIPMPSKGNKISFYTSKVDLLYTGEVSAIAVSGNPVLRITEI